MTSEADFSTGPATGSNELPGVSRVSRPDANRRAAEAKAMSVNVLVVDDSAVTRMMIVKTLKLAEAPCVVYGMPREAYENGASEEQVPLPHIARKITDALAGKIAATAR